MMFKNIPAEPRLQGFDSNNHHRQGIIELWRFLFCVLIMCCHKTHAKAAINYTYNKFKTFVPYIVITVFCFLYYKLYIQWFSFGKLFKYDIGNAIDYQR